MYMPPTEVKSDDTENSFYEELEFALNEFPKYHMKILFGDFSGRVEREDIFKPTVRN
jgi:hypothetical protein